MVNVVSASKISVLALREVTVDLQGMFNVRHTSCVLRMDPSRALHFVPNSCDDCFWQQDVELNKSWRSALTFSWVTPILEIGSKRQLGYCDLFPLPKDMSVEACCSQLFRSWEKEKSREGSGPPSLVKARFTTFGRPWVTVGIVKVFSYSPSFVLLMFNRDTGLDRFFIHSVSLSPVVLIDMRTRLELLQLSSFQIPPIYYTGMTLSSQIINDSLSFSGPLFLNEIMKFLESGELSIIQGLSFIYICTDLWLWGGHQLTNMRQRTQEMRTSFTCICVQLDLV